MLKFDSKVFKLGNSVAMYIPKCIYSELLIGKVYTFEVDSTDVYTKENIQIIAPEVIIVAKPAPPTYCEKKHKGRLIYARNCGCY